VYRNLVLSGGVAHDFWVTSRALSDVLLEIDVASTVSEDLEALVDVASTYDLISINCVRWTCSQPEVSAAWREQWASELPEAARTGLTDFLARGGGLIAFHAATICFDDWPEFAQILGASWTWGTSGHAPFQRHKIEITGPAHPITDGLSAFEVDDELYTDPAMAAPVTVLAEGAWEGETHPIAWTHTYGKARVFYDGLGHGPEAFLQPVNRQLIQRGARWVLGLL